ncbi:sporulation initiation factor Spo0A C-terminal domain-containing protein, partial [Dysosmobacter welbionis]
RLLGRPPLPDGKNAGMAERSVLKQIKQAVPGFTRGRFCAWYFISSARTPDQCSRRDPPGADLRSAEPGRTAAWRTFWPSPGPPSRRPPGPGKLGAPHSAPGSARRGWRCPAGPPGNTSPSQSSG